MAEPSKWSFRHVDSKARENWIFAGLFWGVTYVIFTVRAELATGDPAMLVNNTRLAATGVGAGIYWLTLNKFGRGRGNPRERLLRLLIWLCVAAAAMWSARLILGLLDSTKELQIYEGSARWVLVWAGYFSAWTLGFLAFRSPRNEVKGQVDAAVTQYAPEMLWVQQGKQWLRVVPRDVEWIQAEGNYVRVHHKDGSGLFRTSLNDLAVSLSEAGFIRVHRSALCHRDKIASYSRSAGTHFLIMLSGANVPVSRRRAQELRDALLPAR